MTMRQATGVKIEGLLREIDEAAGLFAELVGTPEPDRRALVEEGVRFHSLRLCVLLEARSREVWFRDPAEAVSLAELTVVAAERLDEAHYGLTLAADARASAWAHLGNALRIADPLRYPERVA